MLSFRAIDELTWQYCIRDCSVLKIQKYFCLTDLYSLCRRECVRAETKYLLKATTDKYSQLK